MSFIIAANAQVDSNADAFAKVSWCAEDILQIMPEWDIEQCADWLATNEDDIADHMRSTASDYISALLADCDKVMSPISQQKTGAYFDEKKI